MISPHGVPFSETVQKRPRFPTPSSAPRGDRVERELLKLFSSFFLPNGLGKQKIRLDELLDSVAIATLNNDASPCLNGGYSDGSTATWPVQALRYPRVLKLASVIEFPLSRGQLLEFRNCTAERTPKRATNGLRRQ